MDFLSPSPIVAHSHLLHKVAFISLSSVKTLAAVDVLLISMYLQCKRKKYLEESLKINLIKPSLKWTLHVKFMVIEVHYLAKLINYQVLIVLIPSWFTPFM